MVYVSEGIIAKTVNAHDEDSSESDGSSSSQAMEVDSVWRRNHDDSMYLSSEDSVRARKKEAAGDVSMLDKEQNEQTEIGILSKEEKVLRNPGRLRPGSRAARTPRKRTQAGAGSLLRLMKYLEDAIKGVSSRASEALGESEETSCWHPAVHAATDDAGRSIHDPIEQENNRVDTVEGGREGGYPLGA